MRRIWRVLLRLLVRALRGLAGVGESAARAIDDRLAANQADRELEAPAGEPPAHWLAAVERREPPAHWLEHVQRRAPGVRFQHYRATTAPPSPVVRLRPAGARMSPDRRPGRRTPENGQPRPPTAAHAPQRLAQQAALPGKPAGQGASPVPPGVAARRKRAANAPGSSQPDSEPDAGTRAAAVINSAVASTPQDRRPAPSPLRPGAGKPGRLPDYAPTAKRNALARLLARLRRSPRRLDPRAVGEERRDTPPAGLWPPGDRLASSSLETTAEKPRRPPLYFAAVQPRSTAPAPASPSGSTAEEQGPAVAWIEPGARRWPALPGEQAYGPARTGAGEPGNRWPARPGPWPDLLPPPYKPGEGLPAADEPEADRREAQRRLRLDDEQRGLLWNGSTF